MNHATCFSNVYTCHFTLLFNAQKKHVLNYFALEMDALIVARRRHCRDQRARGTSESFFLNVWIYFECQKNILFAKPCYFYLLQEIKDDLEPSTSSRSIPALSKLLANLHFLGFWFFSMYCGLFIYLFFICAYANLRCAWYIALVDM